ncbi:MAG: DUF1800 domain-containing protein, partial [Myxococcota bacterium]
MDTDPFVAATRFGLGARPGDLAAIRDTGPRDWLLAQLAAPDAYVESRLAGLPRASDAVLRLAAMRGQDADVRKTGKLEVKDAFVDEHSAHLAAAAGTTMPFRERLVACWSNQFTVSIARKEVTGLAGAFEREVIRPGIDGSFADLVVASARHPAMLAYLDNAKSVGPESMAGRRGDRGLNENYAREVLELHTLGVNGGYDQADVTALARLLTGWTLDLAPATGIWPLGGGGTGGFAYRAERHEPGTQVVLGRSYRDAETALRDLAVHPSTARHVATRLVRQFVADDPPDDVVTALAQAFLVSGGDLPTVHRALVGLDAAWSRPLTKVKTPWDLVVSTSRALGGTDGTAMLRSLKFLGQLPYQAPSPQGWPDRAADWIGPGALWARLEWASEVGRRAPPLDAVALADDVLGPALDASTRRALARAPTASAWLAV